MAVDVKSVRYLVLDEADLPAALVPSEIKRFVAVYQRKSALPEQN